MRRIAVTLMLLLGPLASLSDARSCKCSDSDGCLILNAAAAQAMLPMWDEMTSSQQSLSIAAAMECVAKHTDKLDVASKPLVARYFRVNVESGEAKGCSGVVREAVFACEDAKP